MLFNYSNFVPIWHKKSQIRVIWDLFGLHMGLLGFQCNAVSNVEACFSNGGGIFRSAVILGESVLSIGAGCTKVVLAFAILWSYGMNHWSTSYSVCNTVDGVGVEGRCLVLVYSIFLALSVNSNANLVKSQFEWKLESWIEPWVPLEYL